MESSKDNRTISFIRDCSNFNLIILFGVFELIFQKKIKTNFTLYDILNGAMRVISDAFIVLCSSAYS